MGKEVGKPEQAWEALRGNTVGRFLPSWPELLVAIRRAYGDGLEAMRKALRGEISWGASAEATSFYQSIMEDLVMPARARGFPTELRIWTANRDTALCYLAQKDGEERLRIDCYQLSPDDSRHLGRCGLVADALFSNGALISRRSEEIAVSPLGIGIPQWRQFSETVVRRIGEELTLALNGFPSVMRPDN